MNFRSSDFDSRLGCTARDHTAGNRLGVKSKIRRGLTLIEVLVAIAIFGFIAVVLASSYVNILMGYQSVAKANVANEDLAFARQLVMTEPDLQAAQNGGNFDSANNRRVKWSSVVTPTTTTDLFSVELTIEVSDSTAADQKTVQTFLLLRPTWSDPAERTKLRQAAKDRITALQQGKQ